MNSKKHSAQGNDQVWDPSWNLRGKGLLRPAQDAESNPEESEDEKKDEHQNPKKGAQTAAEALWETVLEQVNAREIASSQRKACTQISHPNHEKRGDLFSSGDGESETVPGDHVGEHKDKHDPHHDADKDLVAANQFLFKALKHEHPLSYEGFSSSVGKQGRLELKKKYQALLHKAAIGRFTCCFAVALQEKDFFSTKN
jgi:hypothetical protein